MQNKKLLIRIRLTVSINKPTLKSLNKRSIPNNKSGNQMKVSLKNGQ